MMVIRMAKTPSLNASSRPLLISPLLDDPGYHRGGPRGIDSRGPGFGIHFNDPLRFVEISSSDMDVILAAWVAMAASRTGDDKIAALLQKTAYPLTEAIQKATAIVKEGVLVSA